MVRVLLSLTKNILMPEAGASYDLDKQRRFNNLSWKETKHAIAIITEIGAHSDSL